MKPNPKGMNQNGNRFRASFRCALSVVMLSALALMSAPAADRNSGTNIIRIVQMQGVVQIMAAGDKTWITTQTNQTLRASYKLRTSPNSRATLLWSDQSILTVDALTELEILPPDRAGSLPGLIVKGTVAFLHRDKPGRIQILTGGSTAGVKGTEFVLTTTEVNGDERVLLTVIDGVVELSNRLGTLMLTNQQGVIEPGQPPVKTPGFIANNLLQWAFYYPGILDLRDLSLTAAETQELKASLDAYRGGDLLQALALYPTGRQGLSGSEQIYHAALLLSVGQVEQTEAKLAAFLPDAQNDRLAGALRTLIAAVKRSSTGPASPELASELLAESYYQQSLAHGEESLKMALLLARRATTVSPEFGFAWVRVAELEFSFGRTYEASHALDRSMALSPRNAQALALRGFLLAAKNRITEAKALFDQAIATDGALGNAWLGRGLCRIRRGDAEGREDLLIAAALEPQRSLLRSYLGKAYANFGHADQARHELEMAKRLDQKDPTVWLYSALLNEQNNRFNEGIRDLEKSQELNEKRRVFRSRLLLDEDLAVRSTSLASLYQEAGMPEVSLREASRSASYDYANYSSHLFLSESYNALRDPTRFNLRYETVWFNELLLANLLSPVGAGAFSQNISQQEYTRLFEQDRLGLSSATAYRSDGQFREIATQFGQSGRFSYALDVDYQHNDGIRVNNDLDRFDLYSTLKFQISDDDMLLLLTKLQDYQSGDNFQYYDQTDARPNYRFDNEQSPLLAIGWHHEWSPESHTLALAGRLENKAFVTDQQANKWRVTGNNTNQILLLDLDKADQVYDSQFEIWFGELNQIWTAGKHTVIAGGRAQTGSFNTFGQLSGFSTNFPPYPAPLVTQDVQEDFHRWSVYIYDQIQILQDLALTAGVAYDSVAFPANFREVPVTGGEIERSEFLPKAALVWELSPKLTLRGMYAWSLSGASFDESFRLEPAQLAGFIQSFRTVIPESVAGSVSGQLLKVWGGALDFKLTSSTYAGVGVHGWKSDVERDRSSLYRSFINDNPAVLAFREQLDYSAEAVGVNVNQLLGERWSAGVGWRWQNASFQATVPGLVSVSGYSDQRYEATLNELWTRLQWQHPAGPFFRAEAGWLWQKWHRASSNVADGREYVSQVNLQAGWRFLRNRGELAFGVLNLGGEDYRLDPLSGYSELPRERVFFARLQLNF